jgi:hypothetical protein
MQLKINEHDDIVFEWIPYNQFNKIEETSKSDSTIVYSAIWKNGPLHYDDDNKKYIREPDKKIALKCLRVSQNIANELLSEV